MSYKHKTIFFFIITAFLIIVHSFIFNDNTKTIKSIDEKYCKMVKIHMLNPAYGWPDYNQNYNKICK